MFQRIAYSHSQRKQNQNNPEGDTDLECAINFFFLVEMFLSPEGKAVRK